MTDFINPESHSNIKNQLTDLQRKFGELFSHMEGVETKIKEEGEKMDSMIQTAEALKKLKIQSNKFLEEGETILAQQLYLELEYLRTLVSKL